MNNITQYIEDIQFEIDTCADGGKACEIANELFEVKSYLKKVSNTIPSNDVISDFVSAYDYDIDEAIFLIEKLEKQALKEFDYQTKRHACEV